MGVADTSPRHPVGRRFALYAEISRNTCKNFDKHMKQHWQILVTTLKNLLQTLLQAPPAHPVCRSVTLFAVVGAVSSRDFRIWKTISLHYGELLGLPMSLLSIKALRGMRIEELMHWEERCGWPPRLVTTWKWPQCNEWLQREFPLFLSPTLGLDCIYQTNKPSWGPLSDALWAIVPLWPPADTRIVSAL